MLPWLPDSQAQAFIHDQHGVHDDAPGVYPPEWCGLIDSEMLCFLHERNGNDPWLFYAMREKIEHEDVTQDHSDLACWLAEMAKCDVKLRKRPGRLPPDLEQRVELVSERFTGLSRCSERSIATTLPIV